jgi:hypothetical protein
LIYTQKQIFKTKNKTGRIARSPRLDTILMVEKTAYRYRSEKTVTQIWHLLPKKVMWTTYLAIINYLAYSGKIIIDKDKTVIWTWNPRKIAELKKKGLVIR